MTTMRDGWFMAVLTEDVGSLASGTRVDAAGNPQDGYTVREAVSRRNRQGFHATADQLEDCPEGALTGSKSALSPVL
ncbi:MAG: hypothetical protein AAF204_04110 [Pseudomonadota bacterium]